MPRRRWEMTRTYQKSGRGMLGGVVVQPLQAFWSSVLDPPAGAWYRQPGLCYRPVFAG